MTRKRKHPGGGGPLVHDDPEKSLKQTCVWHALSVRDPQLASVVQLALRPICTRFQGSHISGQRCLKGNRCPLLHVPKGQEYALAKIRLRDPSLVTTPKNGLCLVPPLLDAVQHWWKHTLQQGGPCPITAVDVVPEGESLVVKLTLNKPMPSEDIQNCVGKGSMTTEDGTTLHCSGAAIPPDRTWWHGTQLDNFGSIVRDSLKVGPQGRCKAVYSFANHEHCSVYGRVCFGFKSYGMVTKFKNSNSTPETIPTGVIGYLDSGGKRQWLHHPENLQLTTARVEYPAACGKSRHRVPRRFLSE